MNPSNSDEPVSPSGVPEGAITPVDPPAEKSPAEVPPEEGGAAIAPPSVTTVVEVEDDGEDVTGDPVEEEEPEEEEGYQDKEMSLFEHLDELRSRCIKVIATWALASCGVYYFAPHLMRLTVPMLGSAKLIFTSPTEAFFAYLQVAMIGGIFVSLPVVLFHFIKFVSPGLKRNEKRWLNYILPVSIGLFFLGASFAYFIVLPVTLKFFLSYAVEGLEAHIKLEDFLGFLTGLLAMCGVVFQLPMVLLFLSLVGIVKSAFLRSQRRIAVFLAFLISAVATPTPDAFTCGIVALPIIGLFEISIWLIWFKEKWSAAEAKKNS